jgi:serine/threonine-protein kinase
MSSQPPESTQEHPPPSTSNVTAATLPPVPGAETTSLAGLVTERYAFGDEIARGGMGVIYRGLDRALGRPLALKVLRADLAHQPDLVRRFLEEAQITGQLQHPGVVPIHEIGRLPDERPFFAMKLVEGQTLQTLLEQRPGPGHELPRFLKVFAQICETVAFAHSRGVLHRDIKPANVMVGAFGEVQVMDWGLAKVVGARTQAVGAEVARGGAMGPVAEGDSRTEVGSVLGTFAYMPPEQARGDTAVLDPRCDVFGLGALLCKILTGHPPYLGTRDDVRDAARSGATRGAHARLDACGADGELVALAKRCLAAEAAARPADAGAVARAMAAHLAGVQDRLRAAELATAAAEARAAEEGKRRRLKAALGLVVLLLGLVVGLGAMWWQIQLGIQEAEEAIRKGAERVASRAALAEARRLYDEGLRQTDDPERWQLSLAASRSALKRANANEPGTAEGLSVFAEYKRLELQLDEAERDCQLLLDLDRLWLDRGEIRDNKIYFSGAAPKYAAAFRRWGLDLATAEPAAVAARLKNHHSRAKLLAALEDWLRVAEGEDRARLRLLLSTGEPEPGAFGRVWREAAAARDGRALAMLAAEEDPRTLPALAVLNLARDLSHLGFAREAVKLLRAGLERHPDDFWLNYEASREMRRLEPPDLEGALRCAAVAVALRPKSPATHLLLGNAHFARKELDDAIRCYQQSLRLDVGQALTHSNLGVAFMHRKDLEESLHCNEKAVALAPELAVVHYNLGSLHKARKDFAAAARAFLKAAEIEPRNARYVRELANALFEQKDYEAALPYFRLAVALSPRDAYLYQNLANLQLHLKDYVRARQNIEHALALDPNLASGHHAMGTLLDETGDPYGALLCYERTVAIDPNFVTAYENIARILLDRGDFHAGLRACLAVVTLDPKSAKYHNNLGVARRNLKDLDGAIEAFEAALAVDGRFALAHVNLGECYRLKNDFDNAVRCYQAGLAIDPTIAFGQYNLAVIRYGRKEYEAAAVGFALVTRLEPKNVRAWFNLGVSRLAQHDYPAAAAAFEGALALRPRDPLAHNNLANAYFEMFDLARAKEHYDTSAQLNPKDPAVHNNLGNVHKYLGDLDAAEASYRKALKLSPRYTHALVNLGTVLETRGDLDGAIAQYEEAIRSDAKYPLSYYNLGTALSKKGQLDKALSVTLQGQKLAADSPARSDFAPQVLLLQRLHGLDGKLEAVLKGEEQASPRDRADLGRLCSQHKGRHAEALKLFAEAFAAEPALVPHHRFYAACSAVQLGCGTAGTAAERVKWRKQALAWLSDELSELDKKSAGANPATRRELLLSVNQRRHSYLLAGVRGEEALKEIPEDERAGWRQLWRDYDALAARLVKG